MAVQKPSQKAAKKIVLTAKDMKPKMSKIMKKTSKLPGIKK